MINIGLLKQIELKNQSPQLLSLIKIKSYLLILFNNKFLQNSNFGYGLDLVSIKENEKEKPNKYDKKNLQKFDTRRQPYRLFLKRQRMCVPKPICGITCDQHNFDESKVKRKMKNEKNNVLRLFLV